MVKRKLASHDNLKITLEQTGDKFHIKESSNFRTLELDFTLGVTFDYSLADGTELSVSEVAPFSIITLNNYSKTDLCKTQVCPQLSFYVIICLVLHTLR